MTTIKSYRQTRESPFQESTVPPVYLGELNGRAYYAFGDEVTPASGGKAITADERQTLLDNCQLIKQVKAEAKRRILAIAPYWCQLNALADVCLLASKAELTDDEVQRLAQATQLWETIHHLRSRSNEIERKLLQGEMVDYTHDDAWKQEAEPEPTTKTE